MGCLLCGFGGSQSSSKKLPVMNQRLKDLGFVYVSSCHCHGPVSYTYSYPNTTYRIEVSSSQVWIKVPNPIAFSVIDFGNQDRFDEFLNKYFGLC